MGLKKNYLKVHKTVKALGYLYLYSFKCIPQNLYHLSRDVLEQWIYGIKTDFAESYVVTILYEDVHLSRLLHIFVIWTNVFARKDQEIRFCHEKFKEELELWRLTQNHNTIMILRQPPMSHKQKSKK